MLTRRLRKLVPLVVGIDSDQVRIELARSCDGTGSIVYILGDFMDCPFPPASFDLITSIAALHHMPADSALSRMRELLIPGGTLAIIGLARNGIIGLARNGIIDLPFELARAIATRLHTHRKGYWNHPSPMVWPPPLSYRQMRHIAAGDFPACSTAAICCGGIRCGGPSPPVRAVSSRCVGWVFRREGCGALHEVPQFGTEAGGRGPVHDVVVDGDGEVQNVVDDDLIIDCDGASAQSAHDDHKRRQCRGRDGESGTAGEHAYRTHLHGAGGQMHPL
jgi:SAM-dependent methyltransferase